MATRGDNARQRPLYMISVAAELAGVHPQTLRIYERRELIRPQRSAGNTRLYSEADIERLRTIQHLTQVEGINLAGVERIIELERQVETMRADLERLRQSLEESARRSTMRTVSTTGLVVVRRGSLARRGEA